MRVMQSQAADDKVIWAKCSNCKERTAAHSIGDGEAMCCICYVVAGNPPADWHTYCMETYRWLADLRAKAGK